MQNNSYTRGKFITFEGGEGAGKTTQAKRLQEVLEERNIKTLLTREPGGTKGAEAIRALLVEGEASRWDARTELLLHLAARLDHVQKVILPALERGVWVICDRFSDSTLAYQGYGHQLGVGYVEQCIRLVLGEFTPDITFFMDIPLQEGMARAAARRGQENRYESMDLAFHTRVYEGFVDLASCHPHRILRLDARGDVESLHQEILRHIA